MAHNAPSFLAPASIARIYARVSTKEATGGAAKSPAVEGDAEDLRPTEPRGLAKAQTFTAVSIVPLQRLSQQAPTTFREVIAYLNGVADTVAARGDYARPVSVAPLISVLPASGRRPIDSDAKGTRITLRFGEIPFAGASVWPHVVVGSSWEPTRGGARTVDLGELGALQAQEATQALRRYTLPYDVPSISLAPITSAPPSWAVDERESQVRLRAGALPEEWYELTGTQIARVS